MSEGSKTKYGLPEKVIFCKRCVMSNQKPNSDQSEWKNFIISNLSLMNDEFFKLSRNVFLHFLEQTVNEEDIKSNFLETWDKTTESIKKIKDIPKNN